jgi:glycosyltransferase involved in cell wall biosynthesis
MRTLIKNDVSAPLLSIAIPSFNRCSQLIACLNMFAEDAKLIGLENFEIVVSDNASTDRTEEMVHQWRLSKTEIKSAYFKNEKNLGVDANCHLAIERSKGHFVWLFSDDDEITKGALRRVHDELLSRPNVCFCFANYLILVGDREEQSSCHERGVFLIRGDELLNRTRFALSFVSSCIFNREVWASVNPAQYIGTYWYHMFVARDMLPQGDALLIGDPMVMMNGMDLLSSRQEKRRSDHATCEFYIAAHLRFLSFAFTLDNFNYPKETCLGAEKIGWASNLRQIFYFKAVNPPYNFKEIKYIAAEMARYFWRRPMFWGIHIPLLVAPSFITGNLYWAISPSFKKLKAILKKLRVGGGD